MGRSSSHLHKKGTEKSPSSTVMRLVLMFALLIGVSAVLAKDVINYVTDIGKRSLAVSELQQTGNRLLKENHDLRIQKAFLDTPRGKEIVARRNLYKRNGETYAIITTKGQD